ncbi:energy-coupling factor transporter transmembrane component T [Bacillus sp. OK048]|uniref:energy-coupling factor transporter transmembrane component T n=1 Tax=Bacillus sp. OK048 TaxID=1882761 RepID=UPI0008888895|nr:energy-coupling factor transporter transmembrane component T [Bacillus sp. OK048]SDM38762.1 energy-coupling factor transport system permease protein [Bacillus sp. OK048]
MKITFERYHPLVTFFYYLGSLSLLLFMLHPVFLCFGFLVILAINYLHDRLKGMKSWLFLMLSIVVIIVLMNPIFNERGRHVLFVIWEHRITLEALVYGGMNALSIISVIAIFISYNYIMTPNKLLFLFSKFLPQFAILLMLTLRFIPLMRRRLEEIILIQKSKGMSVNQGKWRTRARTGMLYVQALLVYSLEEAIQTADSMKARGYGKGRRSTYEFFHFRRKDTVALIILFTMFVGLAAGRHNGYGVLTIYPVMEAWQLSTVDVSLLILYGLFLSFPLLVEAGEMFKWRLLN